MMKTARNAVALDVFLRATLIHKKSVTAGIAFSQTMMIYLTPAVSLGWPRRNHEHNQERHAGRP